MADDRLLPVLAARVSAVDDAVGELFGDLSSKAISAYDREGQAAGRSAADAASLTLERDRIGSPSDRRALAPAEVLDSPGRECRGVALSFAHEFEHRGRGG